tara:strand:+ start:77 stop:448 length:372 start_codon:yes stop_codon:yes gene_type:complete
MRPLQDDVHSYADALVVLAQDGLLWSTALEHVEVVVQGLAHLQTEGRADAAWMADVVALLGAVQPALRNPLFWMLDEHPRRWGWTRLCQRTGQELEWHWKLRRTRNDPTWGHQLFNVLGGRHG